MNGKYGMIGVNETIRFALDHLAIGRRRGQPLPARRDGLVRAASHNSHSSHNSHRLLAIAVAALCFAIGAATAQDLDPAGIKAKVAEAAKANQSAAQAQAQGKPDEAKQFAETSARLFAEARADYTALRADESDDVALIIDYADLLATMGDFDLAEKALLRAVSLDRENAAAWLKLGQAEGQLGPRGEPRSIRSLRRAAEIEPKTEITVQANASLGAMYQQSALYDFAREAYEKALEQDANHIGSKLAIAALDAREGQMVKAKAAYEAVGDAAVQYGPYIGRTLIAALDDFEQSRRFLEDTPEMHLAYAELLVRAGRLQDSYWPLNRSLKLDDSNYIAWNLMGSLLRSANKLDAARGAFEKSLALNGDQPRTRDAIAELDAAIAGTAPPAPSPDAVPATPEAAPDNTPVPANTDPVPSP